MRLQQAVPLFCVFLCPILFVCTERLNEHSHAAAHLRYKQFLSMSSSKYSTCVIYILGNNSEMLFMMQL